MSQPTTTSTRHTFKPGNTLGGKPKSIGEVRDLARSNTLRMLQVLVDIAEDREERGSVRVVAADLVLTRAWGKAEAYHTPEANLNAPIESYSTNELTHMLSQIKVEAQAQAVIEAASPIPQLEHTQDTEIVEYSADNAL